MAYDYEKTKAAYEKLSKEQQKQFVEQNKDNANVQQFAMEYARDMANSSNPKVVQSPYENQGAGNYVYNERTWYYENQTDTSRNTTNQGLAPRPENVKTETPTKQQETVVNTVPEIKQQGQLKPLSQDYYNQTSDEAQNRIRANLNWYRQTNPELFSTYEDFKKNFSYDSRDEVQKQTLDNWYTGYQKSMELSAVPTNELYTQYKDWTVSLSDLETLRISNPTKYAELQETINKWNIISAYDDDKGEDTTWMSIQDMAYNAAMQMFTKWMSGDTSSGASQIFREYEEKMNDPEMLELADNCTEVENEIENIQMDLDSMKKSVEKEYEWTWASRAKINAIVWDRTYELQLQLRTLNSIYNKYTTQYNNRMQQYQNEFNMQLQEYQINQNERQTQMKELGFALDLMNFETNDQKQEREWNYWVKQQEYQNWNINSKDYQTRYKAALTSVQNLLSQYEWIPMERSAEQMAQDVLKAIDGGSDLGAELTKINKLIQQKPEYKYLYNNTYGKWNDISYQTFKLWDQEYIVYNNELMSSDEFNKKYWGKATGATWDAKPYDIVDAKVFSQTPVDYGYETLWTFLADPKNAKNSIWWWCGAFVNKYLKAIWVTNENYYDDNLSTKLNSVNTKVPKEWTIAVFDFGHITKETGQNHGHVWIVTKVYSDWSFDVIESNYNSDKKIWTRQHINPQSSSVKWFFDPSQPPAWSSTQWGNSSFVSWSIDWVPLAYERAVKNLVPAALQNSDAEREALNTVITNSYNWWIDQSQIALTFMGFDIRNEEDKNLALDLVNTVRTLSTDTQEWIVQTISDLMNQGNYTKAIQTVENAVSQQAQAAWNYIPESSVKNTMNRVNSLSNYISTLKDSPVGVVEWNMQEWLWKLSSSKSKEILNRIAAIESTLDIKDADTRARIVPQLSDQPSVFMSKLNNLNENLLSELNSWREIYGLPNLTTDALQNYSNRVSLYRNLQNNTTNTTQNSSDARYMSVMSDYSKNMTSKDVVNIDWYDFPSKF